MEILNKNQRETAVWRLIAFGVLVLAANAFIMFASFKAFQDKGAGDANSLRKKLEDCEAKLLGVTADLKVKENSLIEEKKKMGNLMKSRDPEKDAITAELKLMKAEYDMLDKKYNRCLQESK